MIRVQHRVTTTKIMFRSMAKLIAGLPATDSFDNGTMSDTAQGEQQ